MSKKYIDSKLWDDDWFQNLTYQNKLLWIYLFSTCDEMGVWKLNKKQAEFQIGFKIQWENLEKSFNNGKKRILFTDHSISILEYILFQYGNKIKTSNHPFHVRLREKLKSYPIDRVSDRVGYPIDTLIEKEKETEEEKEKEKEKEKSHKIFKIPSIEEVKTYIKENGYDVDFNKWFNFYSSKGWMIGKNHMQDWKAAVRTWATKSNKTIEIKKPPPVPQWMKYMPEEKPYDGSDGKCKML
jgi:hypothetical protein